MLSSLVSSLQICIHNSGLKELTPSIYVPSLLMLQAVSMSVKLIFAVFSIEAGKTPSGPGKVDFETISSD